MTQEEILEGNKLIAEFDGWTYNNDDVDFSNNGYYTKDNTEELYGILTFPTGDGGGLKYHYYWDWLMPVVEKIEDISEKSFRISNFKVECHYFTHSYSPKNKTFVLENYIQSRGISKIEATFYICIEFIKWYNEQNR